ncbi:MAG: hypothetical protein Q4A21_01965 [bacterium]|nr:hypothetical protein [bacterium]
MRKSFTAQQMVISFNRAFTDQNLLRIADWFDSLRENEKQTFQNYCQMGKIDSFNFAQIASQAKNNPEIHPEIWTQNRLIEEIFKLVENFTENQIPQAEIALKLLNLIWYNRMLSSAENVFSENLEIFVVNSVSMMEAFTQNLLRLHYFDRALEIAFQCWDNLNLVSGEKINAWKIQIALDIIKIIRLKKSLPDQKISPEMLEILRQNLKVVSKDYFWMKRWEKFSSAA